MTVGVALILSTLFITLSYLLFIVILKSGWTRARKTNPPVSIQDQLVSVIVPVRNEGKTIGTLLAQLKSQSHMNCEIIVVDDHSNDRTALVVEEVSRVDSRFRLIKNDGAGKKAALTTGITYARGAIIVTTDGDCEVAPLWLKAINQYFQDSSTKMVFGGVSIQGTTFFTHLQAIEFSSLIGSGISFWAFGKPVMCNGANLAFRKEIFVEIGGYSGNEHIASGDDEFLMRKILKRYPDGIRFLNESEGNVLTAGAADVKKFLQQRLRWAGKWRHNQSTLSRVTALYVLLVQLGIIVMLLGPIIFPDRITPGMTARFVFMRFILEAWFLIPVCRFLRIKWRWDAFLLLQFIYPFYVAGIGLFSNLTTVKWKDRRI